MKNNFQQLFRARTAHRPAADRDRRSYLILDLQEVIRDFRQAVDGLDSAFAESYTGSNGSKSQSTGKTA
tara:strand:+ start:1001 stop:1207 length:207 start_codon:yes stop_codon:yes gene_type:complete